MKTPIDNPLFPFIQALHWQANLVGKSRNEYLAKEAERKHFEATLIMAAKGTSQKEKEWMAQASKEWLIFQKELAKLEAIWEFQKLKFTVIEKEYFAQHQSLSLDAGLIKKEQC